jgi:hypothetical protein
MKYSVHVAVRISVSENQTTYLIFYIIFNIATVYFRCCIGAFDEKVGVGCPNASKASPLPIAWKRKGQTTIRKNEGKAQQSELDHSQPLQQ